MTMMACVTAYANSHKHASLLLLTRVLESEKVTNELQYSWFKTSAISFG